jgi:hypothetical protein
MVRPRVRLTIATTEYRPGTDRHGARRGRRRPAGGLS